MCDDEYWVKRLTAAAEAGEVVDLDPERVAVTAHHDPDAPDEVRNERWIPASAIRAVLVKTVISEIDPRGLRIRYARIVGDVDWEGLQFDRAVHLTDCFFEHVLDISSASIRELSLSHSTIPGAVLDSTKITGSLHADRLIATGEVRAIDARIDGQVRLREANVTNPDGHALKLDGAQITGSLHADGLIATGEVRAGGAHIDGQVNLTGAKLTNPGGYALILDQAQITGGLFARGLIATGEVRALGAHIDGQADLTGAKLTNSGGHALALDQAQITGSLVAGGLIATGEVRAGGAHIDGQVDLTGAKLTNSGGHALALDRAQITGSLVAGGVIATGEVRALGARIDGQVDLREAELTNSGGKPLALDQAQITGGLFAGGVIATGEVRALGARIDGQADLTGAKLTNPGGYALILDQAQITGGLVAGGVVATGEVRAAGARIDGQADLTGAKLTNPGGYALILDQAQITGGLLAGGVIATGEVRAGGAHIDRLVDLTGAKLTNPGGRALALDRAQITGILVARGLIATGEVRAASARIDGPVDLRDTKLFNRSGPALTLDRAQLTGPLSAHRLIATREIRARAARINQFALIDVAFYKGLRLTTSHIDEMILRPRPGHAFGEIALERATVGNLVLGNATVPHGPRRQLPKGFDHCTISALGWKIGDVHGPLRDDPRIASELLDRTADRGAPPQPKYELAAVYDRIGRPDFARTTRLTAEQSATSRSTGTTKVLRWIYAATVGYGYRPFLPVLWLVATLVLAGALVWGGRDHFIPVNRADAVAAFELADGATPTAVDRCSDTTGYPCFNSLGYTLQNVVPAASGPLRPDWVLSNTGTGAIALGFALAVLRLLAWGFAALTLAAVTGLLRRH